MYSGSRCNILYTIHETTPLKRARVDKVFAEENPDRKDWRGAGNSFAFDTADDAKRSGNLALVTAASAKTYWIDSTIRVVGANTGFRIDVPVRYVKIQ